MKKHPNRIRGSLMTAMALIQMALLSSACVPGEQSDVAEAVAEDQRPNILFIMLDDLGKEWVSAYGAEGISTPSIDALAHDGLRFDNAWSNPQCTPTRITLLTGQYPFRNGWVNHWDVPRWGVAYFDWERYPSLAGTLKQAGYATAAAGKWQVNDFRLEPEAMVKHGFDSYAMWTGWEEGVEASHERYWDPYIHTRDGSRTYSGEFGADVFVEHLAGFIRDNRDGPWFAYFPLALPHPPYVTTPAQPEVEGDEARFRAMVEYADVAVGRLVGLIDELGLAENTLIIVTTDNGSPKKMTNTINGKLVSGGKAYTSDNGINAPFVARWTGTIEAGKSTKALVDFSDLLPTFAELADATPDPEHVYDGQSFAGLLLGSVDEGPRDWILAMGGGGNAEVSNAGIENQYVYRDRVLRDKRFKLYIAASAELQAEKLVDLASDPEEKVNLLDSHDPQAMAALERLMDVARTFPARDADPQYRPRAANEWDKQVSVESQTWKLTEPAAGEDESDNHDEVVSPGETDDKDEPGVPSEAGEQGQSDGAE
jgi:arylsulfatase A-like enzyme